MESAATIGPRARVLWDRSGDIARRLAPASPADPEPDARAYVWMLNRTVHRALYARKALKRGQRWKAILLLDELRLRTMQLAGLYALGTAYSDVLGRNGIERHADSLPPEILAELAGTLPAGDGVEELRASLAACVAIVLRFARALDGRYGVERSGPLAAVLEGP